MATQEHARELRGELTFTVENIGGIDTRTVEIPPGVTVLHGENATNRTSFLQAIRAVMGSDKASLKADADEGRVTLRTEDATYERTLTSAATPDGEPRFDGTPFLDEEAVQFADRYAFLLADNPIRRTIEQGADGEELYEALMEPVDTEAIETEIEECKARKRELQDDLDRIEDAAEQLPGLEETKQNLLDDRAELEDEIETLEAEIEQLEDEVDEESGDSRAEELQEELTAKRSKLQEIENKLERKKASLEGAKEDLASLELPDVGEDELKTERDSLEEEAQELQARINDLQEERRNLSNAYQTNLDLRDATWSVETLLRDASKEADIPDGPLTPDTSSEQPDPLTDQLVEGEHLVCSCCGSDVNRDQLDAVADQYQALLDTLDERISTLETEWEDLDDRISDIDETLTQLRDKRDEKATLETRIEDYEATIEDLEATRDRLTDEIADLESELDELETEGDSQRDELINKRSTLQKKEYELSNVEDELADVEEAIADAEAEVDERDEVETQLQQVNDQLEELRREVDRIETSLESRFNETMDEVLEILHYENIERIWIERKVEDASGTPTDKETTFDLHVVRKTEEGSFEDVLSNLSESERTVAGLVVALTGYLVHEVHEDCPIMLFDSIEMVDSARIAELIDYFATHTDYLIAALLPEDANTIQDTDIQFIDW